MLKPKRASRAVEDKRVIFLSLIPAWVFLVALIGYPLIRVVWDSFNDVSLIDSSISGFVGLENFSNAVADPYFGRAVKNTILWTVFSVAGEYILGLSAALILNAKFRGRTFFRIAAFIPWLVPVVVAGMTWSWMANPDFGIINRWMLDLGLIDDSIHFLGDAQWALPFVILVNIWRSFPYFMVTFLAALQSIPAEELEAADLDGATGIRRFTNVIFPHLRSASLIIIFVHLIWTAVNFDFIWIMTQGGPNYATITLPILIYQHAIQKFDVGLASALSTMMLLATTLLFVFYYRIRSKLSAELVG